MQSHLLIFTAVAFCKAHIPLVFQSNTYRELHGLRQTRMNERVARRPKSDHDISPEQTSEMYRSRQASVSLFRHKEMFSPDQLMCASADDRIIGRCVIERETLWK